jgi:hypothetical protein
MFIKVIMLRVVILFRVMLRVAMLYRVMLSLSKYHLKTKDSIHLQKFPHLIAGAK